MPEKKYCKKQIFSGFYVNLKGNSIDRYLLEN